MNRWRAGSYHLLISALFIVSLALFIWFGLYPNPFFWASGVAEITLILAGVDLCLGPLLTTAVYRRGKPGLKFDLSVIAVVQAAALVYGMHTLYIARPVYLAYSVDRFELITANLIETDSLQGAVNKDNQKKDNQQKDYQHLPFIGPRLVGVKGPVDQQTQLETTLKAISTGIDISANPTYYVNYDQVKSDVIARAQPLADLKTFNPGKTALVDEWIKKSLAGHSAETLGFVPVKGKVEDLTAIVDKNTGALVQVLRLKPWKD